MRALFDQSQMTEMPCVATCGGGAAEEASCSTDVCYVLLQSLILH